MEIIKRAMLSKPSLLAGLNDEQKEAVLTTDGPVLVIAGAGSGKTRLLTHRIAYLIKEKEISPKNILAVTFTNKAAEEMKERVKKLLGGPPRLARSESGEARQSYRQPWMGTFHHVCVRILRMEIDKIGYRKSFVIYDDADQLALVKRIMKEKELSTEQFNPRAMLAVISKAKGELQNVEDYMSGDSFLRELSRESMKLIKKISKKTTHWILTIFFKKPSSYSENFPMFLKNIRIFSDISSLTNTRIRTTRNMLL